MKRIALLFVLSVALLLSGCQADSGSDEKLKAIHYAILSLQYSNSLEAFGDTVIIAVDNIARAESASQKDDSAFFFLLANQNLDRAKQINDSMRSAYADAVKAEKNFTFEMPKLVDKGEQCDALVEELGLLYAGAASGTTLDEDMDKLKKIKLDVSSLTLDSQYSLFADKITELSNTEN